MTTYKTFRTSNVHPVIILVVLGVFLFIFLRVLRGLIALLALLTPVILIAAAIINYRVLFGYGKWLLATLKSNPIFGILSLVFTVVAFPLVATYLLLKAINTRTDHKPNKRISGEYIKYEEVEEDFLDLSDVKNKKRDIEDKYNDLID